MKNMKAVQIHEYGGPEVLKFEDSPRPEPKQHELLVRVIASSVNPVDWKIRKGALQSRLPLHMPIILGLDISGVVEEVGPDVKQFQKGEEIFARTETNENGAYAEYALVKESEAAKKPKSVDHIHAAAIPLAALTAWQALFDHGGLSAGQKILIHGATGGVGSEAVQLAKWKGAHVAGTSSGENLQLLRELGADEAIDYQHSRFEDVVHDYDVVLDTIGGDTLKRSLKVLKRGGIVVSLVGQVSPEKMAQYGIRFATMSTWSDAKELQQIADLVDSGDLTPVVSAVLPLAEIQRAHEMSEQGRTRGKIVLKVA